MEHPYRVHSSIGFGFLQLLMLSSLAYPRPPPPLYHNIALIRMMGTVYFTMFHNKPIYLKLECFTILLEVIRDALYIRYIIQDYTYLFGVFDIIGNLLFCIAVVLSIENGENRWSKISEMFEGIGQTLTGGGPSPPNDGGREANVANVANTGSNHIYSSLPTNENNDEAPVYTFGGRQAFKPSFYSSSWGRDYLNAKVEREFDRIDARSGIGMISKTDGTTQYIRFDDAEAGAGAGAATGASHYANIFVSPYYDKHGNAITSFSSWTKADTVGACLFIYNLIQFIYQLVMYSSIVRGCSAVIDPANGTVVVNNRWLC
jgi:hypothetical protein